MSSAAEPPSGLVLDASAGVPKLERSSTEVVGGAVVGWRAASWSATGRGSLSLLDFKGPGGLQQGDRAEGAIEAATGVPLAGALRLEARGALGVASYGTTTITAVRPLHDESSLMWRGTALVGLRWDRGGDFAYAQAGAGLQSETHSQTTVVTAGSTQVSLDDSTARTLRTAARAGARVGVWAERVSLRARAEAARAAIRRDRASLQLTSGAAVAVAAAGETEAQRQLELEARVFIDVDALALVGLVPGVFGGVDVVRASSSEGALTATVPVVGVGVFASRR
ncbi:MAG: hypothetical protein IT374_21690 [Polyangiaceae bacterium]|nr:hypothetical protein [Polyangiaceae bacterium]